VTEHHLGVWFSQQVTIGNVAAVGSTLVAFGYQLRRLQDIERDIAVVRDAQRQAEISTASTYARRDVLTETLQSINARLGNIEVDLRDLHQTHVREDKAR
jgi:hypothetical protein